jgi:hypothetical protein
VGDGVCGVERAGVLAVSDSGGSGRWTWVRSQLLGQTRLYMSVAAIQPSHRQQLHCPGSTVVSLLALAPPPRHWTGPASVAGYEPRRCPSRHRDLAAGRHGRQRRRSRLVQCYCGEGDGVAVHRVERRMDGGRYVGHGCRQGHG